MAMSQKLMRHNSLQLYVNILKLYLHKAKTGWKREFNKAINFISITPVGEFENILN